MNEFVRNLRARKGGIMVLGINNILHWENKIIQSWWKMFAEDGQYFVPDGRRAEQLARSPGLRAVISSRFFQAVVLCRPDFRLQWNRPGAAIVAEPDALALAKNI